MTGSAATVAVALSMMARAAMRTVQASYRTATPRIPRRMPPPDSAPTQNSSATSLGTGHPPIFDAPQTFPESNVGLPVDQLAAEG